MIISGSFSYAGMRHDLMPDRREDVALDRDCGTHRVAVLCDGASCCSHGKQAAERAAEAAAGFLAFRFQRCLFEHPETLRLELAQTVSAVLADTAEEARVEPKEFGCTILAAAMDGQGRWCAFHLGDGSLLGKMDPSSDWMIFSYPQSSLAGGTVLTMNGPLFENLRFYRQNFPANRSLMLASDGAVSLFSAMPELLRHPERKAAPEIMERMEDDCSAAWLANLPDV